jgi:S1-C subfamily serine protease
LQVLGLYSGNLDGIIGVRTRYAIRGRQKRERYSATGEITETQIVELEQEATQHLANKKSKPKQVAKGPPPKKSSTSGSGFFISKLGHVLTNQHVVDNCQKVTIGDDTKKQVTANVLETDRRNDLALLKISSMQMASAETKSLIRKLGIKIAPLASDGLLRSEGVELGEDVLVAGYPYGDIFSNSIKVTKGIVSANRGLGDDTGQFQIDAAVQPGNSGGPIYDGNGNIVGVVVSQLNKMKFAKEIGSMPENVNFGIKASTVRQFLTASGLTTKWSKRSKGISTKELAKIAKNQTVMVVCHR